LRANAPANASTFPTPADPRRRPRPRPLHHLREHAHPIYQVGRVYLHEGGSASHPRPGIDVRVHPPPKKIRSAVGSGWYAALYTLSWVTFALATIFIFCNRSRSATTSTFSFLSFSNTNASWSAARRGCRVCSRVCSLELSPESAPGSHSSCPASFSRSSSPCRGFFASRVRSSAARRSSSSFHRWASSSCYT
jgi:hypothetical protein